MAVLTAKQKRKIPSHQYGIPPIDDMRHFFPHVSEKDHRNELARIIKKVRYQLKKGIPVDWHFSSMPYDIPRRTALPCAIRSTI